jgi:hypothetical protein
MKNAYTEHLISNSTGMKQTLLLIFGWLLLSCQQQKQIAAIIPSFKQKLKGDWHLVQPKGYKNFLCFENDSFCLNTGVPRKYHINHDTLFSENKYNKYQDVILKLTNDSLVLLSPATSKEPADTAVYKKIIKKNTIVPTAICYASSRPGIYLVIDAEGNVIFYGESFEERRGGFRGKLSAAQYAVILKQVNNLPVDSLKDFYCQVYASDSPTRGIAIETAGKLLKSTVYGFDKEPVELDILIFKLRSLHQQVSLQADTTVTIDYFRKHPAAAPTTTLKDWPYNPNN